MGFSLLKPSVLAGAARSFGLQHKVLVAGMAGVLAMVPAVSASGGAAQWASGASTEQSDNAALQSGYDPTITQVGVNGSLPQAPAPQALPAYELPAGPLGIPGAALDAYRNAANIMAAEMPDCHIDWALIGSIGRIESNHARGGYVDDKGDTREPILGPVLNGEGPVAAIPDTDRGRFDGDVVWDRAVGPTQFIPATWNGYASDGNGDGESNPSNIFDATLATGRYLCSGGLDLANPDQLRAAIFRYNNSDVYVNTVILWAEAYRTGVAPLPNSLVPVGAPNATPDPLPAPGPVDPPPPAPPSSEQPPPPDQPDPTDPSSPGTEVPGTSTTSSTSSSSSTTTTPSETCVERPTDTTTPTPTETTTTTPSLPYCDDDGSETPDPTSTDSTTGTTTSPSPTS